MERGLLLVAFAIGGVVWLSGFLSARFAAAGSKEAANDRSRFWMISTIVLSALVFLLTLPAHPPLFAAGHGLGLGFLLGGLAGLLATITVLRAIKSADQGDPVSRSAAIAAPIGLALCVSVVPSLWLRDSLLDALCGIAIGWLCAILIFAFGLFPRKQTEIDATTRLCLTLSAGAIILFCTLDALGELRGLIDLVGKQNAVLHWSAPGALYAACTGIVLIFALLPPHFSLRIPGVTAASAWFQRRYTSDAERASAGSRWRVILSSTALLLGGRWISTRTVEIGDKVLATKSLLLKPFFALLGPSPMFHVMALGLFAGLLIWWLCSDRVRQERSGQSTLTGWQGSAAAMLVAAAAIMVGYQVMAGFGVCVLLTSMLLPAGLAVAAGTEGLEERRFETAATISLLPVAAHMVRIFLAGIIVALYRFYSVRFENELHGISLTDHYALFGLLIGVMLPPALTGYLLRLSPTTEVQSSSRLLRLIVTGLLVLGIPTVVIALWGAKCILALFIGLALSTVLAESSVFPALLALAIGLALTQWTHHALPIAQLTRDQKVGVVFWGTAVTVLLMLLTEYGGRITAMGKSSAPSKGTAQ